MQVFPDRPRRIPRADSGFISRDRLPSPERGYLHVVPEILVEVVSPHDTVEELDAKVREYLGVGAELVWVAKPDSRSVEVYRRDGTRAYLSQDDELTGEHVLPEFRVPVSQLFSGLE
jgi:Uma2 family endonuclease